MSEPISESKEAALTRRLAEIDDEIDRLRRKMWRVDKGLDPVADRERELDELGRRYQELSDEFVRVYRAWQEASGE